MAERKKLFIGPRLRRLRRELGLTQAEMAADLDISVSYVNLIERNQRPLTAEMLLRLAETYRLDLASFAEDESEALLARLEEVFRDPLFQQSDVSREDLRELALGNPVLAGAVAALHRAWQESRAELAGLQAGARETGGNSPLEEGRAFLNAHKNYFHSLDERAETMSRQLRLTEQGAWPALVARAENRHGLSVRLLPASVLGPSVRRLDQHRSEIVIAERLDTAGRNFQLALQIVFLELAGRLEAVIGDYPFTSENGRRLARQTLANYTAAAILMPYGRFRDSAEELAYDVAALARRFGTSFEQVCHRLTTLQRPGAEGVSFFFLRIDAAGNVSKRYDGGNFPFARYGGSCPLWNIHDAFARRREILTQVVELPSRERFFSIARTVTSGGGLHQGGEAVRAVALGCAIRDASRLVYARGIDLEAAAVPIGEACRLCNRQACMARAHPPLHHRLLPEDYRREGAPFAFVVE